MTLPVLHCKIHSPTHGIYHLITMWPKDEVVGLLKSATAKPGSVPQSEVLQAVVALEKARCLAKDWASIISAPGKRWRLIYTAGKDTGGFVSIISPS